MQEHERKDGDSRIHCGGTRYIWSESRQQWETLPQRLAAIAAEQEAEKVLAEADESLRREQVAANERTPEPVS